MLCPDTATGAEGLSKTVDDGRTSEAVASEKYNSLASIVLRVTMARITRLIALGLKFKHSYRWIGELDSIWDQTR